MPLKYLMRPAAALTMALCLLLPFAARAETFTCIVKDGQYVNVRKAPKISAATWGVMRTGETIETEPLEIQNGFFRFTFMEHEAYISVDYFELPDGRDYTVTANGRVRARKTPGGKLWGFVQPEQTVRVRAWRYAKDGSLWARCPGPKYIAAEYLALKE